MDHTHIADASDDVTVLFDDDAMTMPVPRGTTMADLAELMAELGAEHGGRPLYVRVRCSDRRAWQRRLSGRRAFRAA